jgi:hypothetical protein
MVCLALLMTASAGMRPQTGHLARRKKTEVNGTTTLKPLYFRSLSELPHIKSRCVLINVYAGTLLVSYPLLIESARRNPETTWLLVHLGEFGSAVDMTWSGNYAKNFILVQSSVEEMVALAEKKLVPEGGEIEPAVHPALSLKHGYKLNDWKPFYGHLFSEWTAESSFWGYWDLDLIYGRFDMMLGRIVDNPAAKEYDIFSPLDRPNGPMTIFRNVDRVNKMCFILHPESEDFDCDWRKQVEKPQHLNFDEFEFFNVINSNGAVNEYWDASENHGNGKLGFKVGDALPPARQMHSYAGVCASTEATKKTIIQLIIRLLDKWHGFMESKQPQLCVLTSLSAPHTVLLWL